jgi:hypothetical protein
MDQALKDLGVVENGTEYENVTPIVPEVLPASHEERLEMTQGVRIKMMVALAPGGKVPTDKDGVKMLLDTMKDFDSQELGIMRQKTDDNNAKKDQIVAQALLELANRSGSSSVMRVDGPPVQRAAIPLDSELPDIEVVPGELETGSHTITYSDMAGRFSREKGNLIEHDPS